MCILQNTQTDVLEIRDIHITHSLSHLKYIYKLIKIFISTCDTRFFIEIDQRFFFKNGIFKLTINEFFIYKLTA